MVPELVSVVIPAYNAGRNIAQAVESVLMQTYPWIECIVVNDGSTDNTGLRLEPYLDRITYCMEDNHGPAAARNRGIEAARGKYIAFLDADDWWEPTKIAEQVHTLRRYPGAGMVYTWAALTDGSGKTRSIWHDSETRELYPKEDIFREMVWGRHLPGAGSSILVKSECLAQAGGFDLELPWGQDWELTLRLARLYDVACVPRVLTHYRNPDANILKKFDQRRLQDRQVTILGKIFAILNDESMRSQLMPTAMARAHWHGALMDYALGRIEQAQARSTEAWRSSSGFFAGPNAMFESTLFVVASYLGYSDEIGYLEPDAVASFFGVTFSNLIPPLGFLRRRGHRCIARIYAQNTFIAMAGANRSAIYQNGRKVFTHDPRWLLNMGLVKAWMQSWSIAQR